MDEDRGFRSIKVLLVVFCLTIGLFSLTHFIESNNAAAIIQQPIADIQRVGNWSVTGTETYSDSIIELNGNLSISGKLVLDNTDLIINTSGSSSRTINVETGGNITIRNGSSISGLNEERYFFISDIGSNVHIYGSTISNCGIRQGDLSKRGIFTMSSNFQILHSRILDGGTGIIGDGATILIRGSNISRMIGTGIILLNGSQMDSEMLNVTDCFMDGISISSSTADLFRCFFLEVESSILTLDSIINLTRSTLDGRDQYCLKLNSTKARIVDTHPSIMGTNHILVSPPSGSSSDILLLNSSFTNIDNHDPAGEVIEAFRFDVKVLTNEMAPAENADVEMKDNTNKVIFQGLTDEFGYINDIPLAVFYINQTGRQSLTPHNVSVFYEGATRQKDVDAASAHYVEIVVILSNPEVIIDYPSEGQWLPTMGFYLNGRAEDRRPITDIWMSIDGSPEARIPGGNPFSIYLELPDGLHQVRIVAKNDDGKYGYVNLSFGIDTIAPIITITTPSNNFYTNSSNVLIRGKCSSDADIFVAGEKIAHPDGEFAESYLLKTGWNEILIYAVDRAGNYAEETLMVFQDVTAPNILIYSPPNGTRINTDEVVIHGSTDIDTALLWVNGEEVDLNMGEFEVLINDLKEGSNRISITAQDLTGTRSTKYVIIIVDTEPPSVILTNTPVLTNLDTIAINGETEKGSTIFINNNIAVVEEGSFTEEVKLIEGTNNFSILAMDDLGNTRVIYHSVILDMDAPTFELVLPATGSEFTNPILEIVCRLYDENGIDIIKGRIGSEPFMDLSTDPNFNWIVTLVEGENLLDIEATDNAGNTVLKQLSYSYRLKIPEGDTELPIVMITSPIVNDTLKEGTIIVEGWAMDNEEVVSVHIRIGEGDWMEVDGITSWSAEVELQKGIYKIDARAVDSSGNEGFDRVWTTIYVGSSDDDDGSSGKGSTSLIVIVIAFFVLLLVFLFGYLLFVRNKDLRNELEAVRNRNKAKERSSEKHSNPRSRHRARERRPPRGRDL
jgi:hypothetical protein